MASFLWLGWVAILAAATAHIWQWHVEYFKSPGPQFYRIALVGIPALGLTACLYAWARRPRLLRYEPLAAAIITLAATVAYEPRATLVCIVLLLSCCAAGKFLLRKLGLELTTPLERIVVGFGAGVGVLIALLVCAGVARALYPALYLGLLLAPLVLLPRDVGEIFTDVRDLYRVWRSAESLAHPLTGISVMFGFAALVCALMIALAPSVAYDPVAFHLPSAAYYATQHRLEPVPNIDYSYYPQGFEMLWALGYSLAGQPGAQMISAVFFLVFVLVLMRLARACSLDHGTALFATVLVATTPFIHWSGSVTKNDLALACFEALALYGFARWLDRGDFRWIVAAAFFLAQAFGIKYVAVFGAIPLVVFLGYAAFHEARRWWAALAVAAILVVFGVSWMIRAYWLTGNLVAPESIGMAVGQGVGRQPRSPLERLERYARIPWLVLFHGEDAFESPLPNPAGILLVALLPLALLGGEVRPKSKARFACAIFTVLYLLYWIAILNKVRYAILPFALLTVWLAARARRFYDSHGRIIRGSLIGVSVYGLLIAMIGSMIVGINGPQIAYFTGRLDRSGYLREAMRAYGAVDYLRESGAGHAPVFAVRNLARFYSPDPYAMTGMWCRVSACDAAEVLTGIHNAKPEYLILPEGNIVPPAVLEALDHPPRVYQDSYFSVFRLSR